MTAFQHINKLLGNILRYPGSTEWWKVNWKAVITLRKNKTSNMENYMKAVTGLMAYKWTPSLYLIKKSRNECQKEALKQRI